ncbi:MoaD/ThiS family protein [Candidatus Micrarchaeota archaeon]|nr:MoaD/ThiS family protein [Candidatus Micrarchaeota archaeon]
MKVTVESRDFKKKVALNSGATIERLFLKTNLRADDFVVSRNGEIILRDERLKDGDRVKLYPVISGG